MQFAWSQDDIFASIETALGDFSDSIQCTSSLYHDVTGGRELEAQITAFDVDWLNNVLIGGRKRDTSEESTNTNYQAFFFLIQEKWCSIKNIYTYDNMVEGIKAVKLVTSPLFSIAYNYVAVVYETSGEEFLIRGKLVDNGVFEIASVKIPIAINSEVIPQGLHVRQD